MVATDDLITRLGEGVRAAAERERRTLVSVTAPVKVDDPCAAVFASRLASDRWFCWEQPDREFALAGLGVAHEAASRGEGRFDDVAHECLKTGRDAILDEPAGLPAGAGPVWVGGFAFDPGGGASSTWSSFSPGSMSLPELSLCRSGGETFFTLNALVGPGDDTAARSAALAARLSGLRADQLPLLDPHPTSR
ncbi:MAG TPA: isochorismate synthase, partial [Solirubrobacterales bacterium]|nr:isochorismate synthase [Solirubrobacterales bacterium]